MSLTDVAIPDPDGTGAASRHEVSVRDLDAVTQPAGGALVLNSRGVQEAFRTLELDTAVGHRVDLVADLFVSAGVDVGFVQNGFSEGTAGVLAEQTAELFYEPSGIDAPLWAPDGAGGSARRLMIRSVNMPRFALLVAPVAIALTVLLVLPSGAGAAPPVTTTAVAVCQGPWAAEALPPAADGREGEFIRRTLRRFRRDPQAIVNAIVGASNEAHEPGVAVWGLPSAVSLSVVEDAARQGHTILMIAPDTTVECPPALGVLVRGSNDFALILAADPDVDGGNSGSPMVVVPKGGSAPATLTVTGGANPGRLQAYCDFSADGGGWTALVAPGARVFYDLGDTATHELMAVGSPLKIGDAQTILSAIEWVRPCP